VQALKKTLNAALAVSLLTTAYGILRLLTSFSTSTSRLALLVLTPGSVILSVLLSLILKPLKFKTRVEATESSYPTQRHPSDVTILVSVDRIEKAATHTDPMMRDWSFEWQNIVEAAVGPHSTIDVSQVGPEDLQNSAVLVLTKSASASLKPRHCANCAIPPGFTISRVSWR